ncbi:non-receptor serine/threonine protein kinase [Lithospermum erythrorhizon]|uniref:non-specific serine/threonine protein kinase n=1 Tax=Lithospermum erythrorhizon TaxID=34254 RepID=A0AAV3NT34_LITER
MRKDPSILDYSCTIVLLVTVVSAIAQPPTAHAFGGTSTTIAVVYGGNTTICTIVAEQPIQQIQCFTPGQSGPTPISLATSFDFIAGGADFFCGLRSGGTAMLCFDSTFTPKRVYFNVSAPLKSVTIGDMQICASTSKNDIVCWRGGYSPGIGPFRSISSGLGFSCGVMESNSSVFCWGGNGSMASAIQSSFFNTSMENIFVGGTQACGISTSGWLICEGNNDNGQLNIVSNSSYEFSGLALGANHSCAIRRWNNSVVCWGGKGEFSSDLTVGVSFESIVAGLDFTCGLTSVNLSIICWGPGWPNELYPSGVALPLAKILPGSCLQSDCQCGVYPQSQELCSGNGNICRPCHVPIVISSPPQIISSQTSSRNRGLRRGWLAFAIIGSVGAFSGICSAIYFLWTGVFFRKKKINNSAQPTVNVRSSSSNSSHSISSPTIFSRSSFIVRQGSRLLRRQRSGPSSKHTDLGAEEFSFSDLNAATNDFSSENKIGAGSFGVVYKGKLPDGHEVAIKRGETGAKMKKLQESAFESELAFLSRLHHKHLVRLVGYCEERDERLLVYEYMKNGALYDHLHDKNNVEKSYSLVNSWKMRIKIALDASRGIEYLHNYAVPPIIHRDIKSSNILLDSTWTARVSDFGLSLMEPENDEVEFKPQKAVGTVGYIDPEYGLNVLTAKSDVYGFGVVLLELLTGKKAMFKSAETGSSLISLVDYAVPVIKLGEVERILDQRVGPPSDSVEAEAIELVAYMAMHCVSLQGKDRPTMADIVANLERAATLCNHSRTDSISSDWISIVLE